MIYVNDYWDKIEARRNGNELYVGAHGPYTMAQAIDAVIALRRHIAGDGESYAEAAARAPGEGWRKGDVYPSSLAHEPLDAESE